MTEISEAELVSFIYTRWRCSAKELVDFVHDLMALYRISHRPSVAPPDTEEG